MTHSDMDLLEPAPLRELVEASLNAREEEARRIARELHDDAGQLLAWAFLALKDVARDVDDEARARLAEVERHLRTLEGRLARLAQELRPRLLDDLGLAAAVEFLAEGVAARAGMHVSVDAAGVDRLPAAVETAAYRIAQEALTNVTRHAHARSVSVGLRATDGVLSVFVRDDGVGFEPDRGASRGLGLLGIRERLVPFDGALSIRSAPGCGTELAAEIPLRMRPWAAASS
ncbi:MAG TPA: sensor histidine kinase [Thermoanaerobaculia bacterium]|nr:sensor histidine kinase [Thermoanaerobaculia bacterium]